MNEDEFLAVSKLLTEEQLLRQLAEECAELSQAALKLIRANEGTTPKTRPQCMSVLIEEIADVQCCIDVLIRHKLQYPEVSIAVLKTKQDKMKRWVDRLSFTTTK